jgi:hypothetical protein
MRFLGLYNGCGTVRQESHRRALPTCHITSMRPYRPRARPAERRHSFSPPPSYQDALSSTSTDQVIHEYPLPPYSELDPYGGLHEEVHSRSHPSRYPADPRPSQGRRQNPGFTSSSQGHSNITIMRQTFHGTGPFTISTSVSSGPSIRWTSTGGGFMGMGNMSDTPLQSYQSGTFQFSGFPGGGSNVFVQTGSHRGRSVSNDGNGNITLSEDNTQEVLGKEGKVTPHSGTIILNGDRCSIKVLGEVQSTGTIILNGDRCRIKVLGEALFRSTIILRGDRCSIKVLGELRSTGTITLDGDDCCLELSQAVPDTRFEGAIVVNGDRCYARVKRGTQHFASPFPGRVHVI